MKLVTRLALSLVLLGGVGVCAAEAPRTFNHPAAALVSIRAELARGDARLAPVLTQLRTDADSLLTRRPASVMDKTKTAASGDRHDYFSFAPYWWPDPAKPTGLPYIRRDGQVNPVSRQGTDRTALAETCDAVETLGLAFWFTGDERYARQAARFTRVWFLDPATRMNPNLEYAQAIPGINDGRGIGIIESRHLVGLIDGLALLAGSPAWPAADAAAFSTWLGEYFRWLTTSKHGQEEAAAENNHGSWYDVQAATLALALGRPDAAHSIIAAVPKNRLARQIEPDGRQPRELARTRSLNYSLFNVEALMRLAALGRRLGVDCWTFSTPDGRSLRAALRHLAPYVDPAKPWLQEDLDRADRARLPPLLVEALAHGDDPPLREPLLKFAGTVLPAERWRLWLIPPR
jgi:hypothetical protein